MNYRNAQKISGDRIDCEIEHPIYGWIPYTLDPDDTDNTINNSDLLEAIGDDFSDYVAPTSEEISAQLASDQRAVRDELLLGVDVVAGNAIRWRELTTEVQGAWATYRQALLDVPQQIDFPEVVAWPTSP